MTYKYSSIKLDSKFDDYVINGSIGELPSLSNINIFIGENNAGKSRFMRELAKANHSDFLADSIDLGQLRAAFDIFYDKFRPAWNLLSSTAADSTIPGYTGAVDMQHIDLANYIPARINDDFFSSDKPNPSTLIKLFDNIKEGSIPIRSYRGDYRHALASLQQEIAKDYSLEFIEVLKQFILERTNFDKHYIPTLRSLNDFDDYQEDPEIDIFESRIRKIYGFDETTQVDVFTGQRIYERVKAMLLGDIDLRTRMAKYEKFLSEKLFDNKEVVIIPKIDKDVVHVRIGTEERSIYDLGDGIQALIILTFPLFESGHGLFFIEEPEINMHPGMQRKFLEALQANPQHQYYFTTHSNHLLDLTIDYSNISIFTFQKKNSKHEVELVTHGDKTVLDLIGARSSSIFLANKSIWVEGITDRLYIKKYLELYLDNNPNLIKPREDIDYIFIEYGGNNITHWSFLDSSDSTINTERITASLLLITDQDGQRKQERKSALRRKLGKRYILLGEREIENTLKKETVVNVIQSYEPSTSLDLDRIDGSALPSTPLGSFIHDEIFAKQGKKVKRRGGYKDTSGTIKAKLEFCHRAVAALTYETMSDSAKKLAEKIHKFIVE